VNGQWSVATTCRSPPASPRHRACWSATSRSGEERPEERAVVDLEHPRVGQVELERGDAFLPDQPPHLAERALADLADGHVEAVVDGRLALGLALPRLQGGAQRLPRLGRREVHDRRRAPERGGPRARLEVVGGPDLPRGHVEMGVDVDSTGEDEAARGVDDRVRGHAQALPDEGDPAAVDVQVGLVGLGGGDDAAVANE
jgi:hypothetical protein